MHRLVPAVTTAGTEIEIATWRPAQTCFEYRFSGDSAHSVLSVALRESIRTLTPAHRLVDLYPPLAYAPYSLKPE